MSKTVYYLREVARKTPIDFNLSPWSTADVDAFEACSANACFDNAFIFTVHMVEDFGAKNVTAVDNGVENFVSLLQEAYSQSNEELKMFGVLRYGSKEEHLKYIAMCTNFSERISQKSLIAELADKAFAGRAKGCIVSSVTENYTAPIDFAKHYIKMAVKNTDADGLPCGVAVLSYGLGNPWARERTTGEKNG